MKKSVLALAVALGPLLGAGSFALAQPAAQAPAATSPAGAPHAHADRPSRIEGRLAFLRTELKITDAQQAKWNALADVMRENDKTMRQRMRQMHASGQAKPMNAVEALERREQMSEARAADLKKFVAALRPLYDSLSPEQKKTADELLVHQGRQHKGHGTHHRF
jgi:Spy/CpxP family protein refolding chaperone